MLCCKLISENVSAERRLSWSHGAAMHAERLTNNLKSDELKTLLAGCPKLYNDMHKFREWIAANRIIPNQDLLSRDAIKQRIFTLYGERLPIRKITKLLQLMCFDFGRLRDSFFEDHRKETLCARSPQLITTDTEIF